MKFNPIVSVALSPDVDWTLHSFDISEASLSTWTDKPWSGKRISKPRSHRNADDRHFPLRHLPLDGQAHDAQQDQPPPPIGPFLHEAQQSIQDLFQAFIGEDLIEGEELLDLSVFVVGMSITVGYLNGTHPESKNFKGIGAFGQLTSLLVGMANCIRMKMLRWHWCFPIHHEPMM